MASYSQFCYIYDIKILPVVLYIMSWYDTKTISIKKMGIYYFDSNKRPDKLQKLHVNCSFCPLITADG